MLHALSLLVPLLLYHPHLGALNGTFTTPANGGGLKCWEMGHGKKQVERNHSNAHKTNTPNQLLLAIDSPHKILLKHVSFMLVTLWQCMLCGRGVSTSAC